MSTIRQVATVRETRLTCDICGDRDGVEAWTEKAATGAGWIKHACEVPQPCRRQWWFSAFGIFVVMAAFVYLVFAIARTVLP